MTDKEEIYIFAVKDPYNENKEAQYLKDHTLQCNNWNKNVFSSPCNIPNPSNVNSDLLYLELLFIF